MKAVILAAGLGTRLEPITNEIPKCMVEVGGVPLIDRMIDEIDRVGITDIIVVTGHMSEVLERHLASRENALARNAHVVFNERYADWGNFYSLLVARHAIGDSSFIKFDADVVLDRSILPKLVAAPGPAVLALDCRDDLGSEDMKARVDASGRVVELSKRIDAAVAVGESIGVDRIDGDLGPALFDKLHSMIASGDTHEYYEYAYERLIDQGAPFSYVDITDSLWCEVDNAADLERAHEVLARQGEVR